jgi:hypothetical protein
MNLLARIAGRSVLELTRIACLLSLVGLSIMAYSVIWPRPLPVIIAMSVGQLIAVAGLACYVIAVVVDVARHRERRSSAPPSTRPSDAGAPPPR